MSALHSIPHIHVSLDIGVYLSDVIGWMYSPLLVRHTRVSISFQNNGANVWGMR
jgi:hypothetical protein